MIYYKFPFRMRQEWFKLFETTVMEDDIEALLKFTDNYITSLDKDEKLI